jgi:LCP family protein required for cell wall assembly
MTRRLGRRFLIALGLCAVLTIGGVVAVNEDISTKIASVRRVNVTVAPAPAQGANYLVLGSTSRCALKVQSSAFGLCDQGVTGVNSDTMMVVHVEPNLKKTLIVSFPRDLWVNVPGIGMAKIDNAFGAGPNKTIQTLEADFDVPINHFISVNFESFQSIIDTIGSVPVYFPYPARDPKSDLAIPLGGCSELNGFQALAYVRSRTLEFYSLLSHQWILADPTADIGRIARQQQFIRELAGIAVQRSLEDPITANEIAGEVLGYMEFDQNLTKNDIFNLLDAFRTVNPNDTSHLDFETLPYMYGPMQGAQDVLYVKTPDDQSVLAQLRDFSGIATSGSIKTITPPQVHVKVVDATGSAALAQSTLHDFVQKAGFRSGGTGSVAHPPDHTEVRYKPGAIDQGELLLQYLTPTTQLLEDPTIKGATVEVVLGKDFTSITLPSGGGSVSVGPSVAGTPQAAGPSTTDSAGDTYANGNGAVNPAVFGPPIPKGPSCK